MHIYLYIDIYTYIYAYINSYIHTHILQGGHQVAKKSTTKSFPDFLDSSRTIFQSSTELILLTREP
jgi:hypothetical protein